MNEVRLPDYGNPHVDRGRWHDPHYGAAFFLFHMIPADHVRAGCFSRVERYGIEKDELLRASQAWSNSERVMVKIALELFEKGCVRANGFEPAGFGEAAYALDESCMRAVWNAVRILRGEAIAAQLLSAA